MKSNVNVQSIQKLHMFLYIVQSFAGTFAVSCVQILLHDP